MQRKAASDPDGRQRTVLYAVAASGLVALAVVIGVLLFAGGSEGGDSSVQAAMEAAGCTLETKQAAPNASDHSDVADPTERPEGWNTDPPSSGPHYGETAVYGAYDEPLEQARVVHNLEHGAVAIQYGPDVSEATVAEVRAFYDEDPRGLLLGPYEPLGDEIALTAWTDDSPTGGDRGEGHLAKCTEFDQEAFQAFLDAYRFKGPERFPADSMLPGAA